MAADLRTFLSRAQRAGASATPTAKFSAHGTVLAVYVTPLQLNGVDQLPLVIGLRAFSLADPTELEQQFAIAAVLDRLARFETPIVGEPHTQKQEPINIALPPFETREPWAGVSPPTSGWQLVGEVSSEVFAACASNGIKELQQAIPEGAGELAVNRMRSTVWSRGLAPDSGIDMPAGMAFGAEVLGFLSASEQVRIYRNGSWIRADFQRGYVISHIAPTISISLKKA